MEGGLGEELLEESEAGGGERGEWDAGLGEAGGLGEVGGGFGRGAALQRGGEGFGGTDGAGVGLVMR